MIKRAASYGGVLGVFGLIALLSAATQEAPKKDDTLAVLQRIEKLLVADTHPRLYKHPFLPDLCDGDRVCAVIEKSRTMKGGPGEVEAWSLAEFEKIGGKELRAKFEKLAADNRKAYEELKKKYPDLEK